MTFILYGICGLLLFSLGLWGLISGTHLLRRILAFNITGSGIFLFLVALAARGVEPDPVPHALVLTGIVVTVSITALALALLRALHRQSGKGTLPEEEEDGPS